MSNNENGKFVDENDPKFVDISTNETNCGCVIDLRWVKEAILTSEDVVKVGYKPMSRKEILDYAMDLQIRYEKAEREGQKVWHNSGSKKSKKSRTEISKKLFRI